MTRRRIAVLLAVALVLAGGAAMLSVEREGEVQIEVAATGSAPLELGDPVAEPVAPSEMPAPNDAATEPLEARDWPRLRHASTDDFALAEELAAAALQGDARAHFVLGQVLIKCEVSKRSLAPYQGGTVAERMERYLTENAIMLESSRQWLRAEASRCARLFSGNPFARLDLPEEAGDFRYWSKRAVDLGDPVAVMDRALRSAAGRDATNGEGAAELRQALLDDVRVAVDAREPAALFMVGTLFSQPAITTSSEVGVAWQVAACASGYDCSNSNPDFGFGCIHVGTCEAGLTYTDIIQRDLGAAKFARIYADAQDIQYKISTNDWAGLQQYLEIR